MIAIHAPRRPAEGLQLLILPILLPALLIGLLIRLWYVQVVLGPRSVAAALPSFAADASLIAPRGLIVDRRQRLIAGNQAQLVLTAVPRLVLKRPAVLSRAADLLVSAGCRNVDEARLLKRVRDAAYDPGRATPIYAGVPVPVAARLLEDEILPGISVELQPVRFYPDSRSFSQLLGYVGPPGAEDLQRARTEGRPAAAMVGKGGLEWLLEARLMGRDGLSGEAAEPATPGERIELSLDADLQVFAASALGGRRGAVVALEPDSGEVLCLVSRPGFDLDRFRNGISSADYEALANDPGHPFLNRAVASAFAPGSTFKIVTTVAAIRAGVFDASRTNFCNGGYSLGNQRFGCLGQHGAIAFREAFEMSCNTYFADLAVRTGKDALREAALDMGFFGKTGIDLPWERTGLIPTDEWLARNRRRWLPGYTVLTGIGQGDVLATPVQMASLAAMVANYGIVYQPHLVRATSYPGELPILEPRRESHRIDLPEGRWRAIRDAMVGVIDRGTAASARIPGLAWGGKTGSAEVAGQALTNSWFIGFAPALNPRIAICVLVEGAGHGSDVAAPIARSVVERYLRAGGVPDGR